jgi:hypothetical protein
MSYLYGDSTTFPYDVDYIELSRHGVECAMQLLSAQHAIVSALGREEAQSQGRNADRARLIHMAEAVESSLAPFLNSESEQVVRAAARALQAVKTALEDERAEGDRRANEGATHAQHVIQRASESAHRALESFLARHDVPETELGLTLSCAGEQGYGGEVAIRSPFGISATFALRSGSEHSWVRPRRVGDLAPGLEIHVPQNSGWISKRIELAPVKLDRLFFNSVRVAGAELELVLTKSANGGSGYRVSVDLRGGRGVLATPLNDNGLADADPPLTLDGEDAARMLELSQRVLESVQGLTALRGSMRSISLDEQPLEQVEWPETAAHRLLAELAPVVLEISRRSGAPGELVLRRDVGGGRREEIYVTKAELWERLLVLPPERRAAFAALGLTAPSLAPAEPAPVSGTVSVERDLSLFEVAAQPALASVGPA